MKKYLVLLTSVLILFSFESKAEQKIAVLDVDKIVQESKVMKDVRAKIGKKQDEFQKEISRKQNTLEAEQKKLESRKSVLSKEAYEKEQQVFEKKVEELRVFVDKKQSILKKAQVESMTKINDKMKEVVDKISKTQSIDVILSAAQTLSYKDEIDISDHVLKELDKKIAKLDIKF